MRHEEQHWWRWRLTAVSIGVAVLLLGGIIGSLTLHAQPWIGQGEQSMTVNIFLPLIMTPPQPITFVSTQDGNAEIYRMKPNGANQMRLTDEAKADVWPLWSNDYAQIAFIRINQISPYRLFSFYTMQADGSGQRLILSIGMPSLWHYAWSPDNRWLIYLGGKFYPDMGIIDLNNLTDSHRIANVWDVDWKPDGAQMAVNQSWGPINPAGVVIFETEGLTRTFSITTNYTALGNALDWSPDGTKIAYISSTDGNPELYLLDAISYTQTRLTDTPQDDIHPVWLSDSVHLLFISLRDGNREIYKINVANSLQTRLTNTGLSAANFVPAPNGLYMAVQYYNTEDAPFLCIMDVNEAEQPCSAEKTIQDAEEPIWSPDSSQVLFTSLQDSQHIIYIVNRDGSGLRRLTDEGVDNFDPDW
ncbi:MAG: hypothetical protein R3C14_09315 [Caldilineaceae bacterium]